MFGPVITKVEPFVRDIFRALALLLSVATHWYVALLVNAALPDSVTVTVLGVPDTSVATSITKCGLPADVPAAL